MTSSGPPLTSVFPSTIAIMYHKRDVHPSPAREKTRRAQFAPS